MGNANSRPFERTEELSVYIIGTEKPLGRREEKTIYIKKKKCILVTRNSSENCEHDPSSVSLCVCVMEESCPTDCQCINYYFSYKLKQPQISIFLAVFSVYSSSDAITVLQIVCTVLYSNYKKTRNEKRCVPAIGKEGREAWSRSFFSILRENEASFPDLQARLEAREQL